MSHKTHFNCLVNGNAVLEARLQRLLPRIEKRCYAIRSPEHEAQDLAQIAVSKLIERYIDDPTFMDQTDAYWLQAATWAAQHASEASRTYTWYVDEEGYFVDDNGDLESKIETFYADVNAVNPEDALIQAEENERILNTLKTLSPQNQILAIALFFGYSQNEIAAAFGLTKGAVTQRKQTIARLISNNLQSPALL